MKAWWLNLSERERRTVTAGGIILALLLLYSLLWSPLGHEVRRLRTQTQQQAADLHWMQQAAKDVIGLTTSSTGGERTGNESLLSIIDRTIKQHRLASGLKRVQPDQDKVRISLEQVAFNNVIPWLEQLHTQHFIKIENVVIEKQTESGLVNVRLVLGG